MNPVRPLLPAVRITEHTSLHHVYASFPRQVWQQIAKALKTPAPGGFAPVYYGLITPLQRQVRAGYRRLRGVPAR